MKVFSKTTFLTLVTVALVGCANGPRSSLLNPNPYQPTITDPTNVVEVTKEHLKAGRGSVERHLFSSTLDKFHKDHGSFVSYSYSGALPNATPNGLAEIRSAWASTCSALDGTWVYPICWDKTKKNIHFLTESYVSKYDEGGIHHYSFHLASKKNESGVNPMLDYVAANFSSYPEIKFTDSKLATLIQQDKALEKFEKGFNSIPALANISDKRIASHAILAFLNTSRSNSFSFDINHTPILVSKVKESNQTNSFCYLIKIKQGTNPKVSFIRSLSTIMNPEENISSIYSVCRNHDNEFAWSWKA